MAQSHLLMIRHWLFFSHQMMLILASMMLTLLNEDGIAKSVVALSADQLGGTEAPNFILSEGGLFLPDVFLMFPYILFAQTVSILTAIKCKNLPDIPSPTGTVNRVVQGVIIHSLEK